MASEKSALAANIQLTAENVRLCEARTAAQDHARMERVRFHRMLSDAFAAIDPTEWPEISAEISAELDTCGEKCE